MLQDVGPLLVPTFFLGVSHNSRSGLIPKAREVRLKPKIRKVLEARCRAPTTAQRDVKRACIVLLAAEGRGAPFDCRGSGCPAAHCQPLAAALCRARPWWAQGPPTGGQEADLRQGHEQAHSGASGEATAGGLCPVDRVRCWPRPWPTLMFSMSGASCASTILTLPPATWCESNDPAFVAKAADVVGLYVDPPAKAIVLCVDEKPSIQALERAQGYLKLPNGRALTGQSHDYKRHGTTTLFAALEVATGRIIAAHSKRRRRVEFLGFMNSLVAAFPDRKLHVILDNLNTHKKNERWLKKHPTVRSISPRPGRRGSIRSRHGFQLCRASHSTAPPSLPSSNCRSTSMLSSRHTTRQPSHSPGLRKRSTSGGSKIAVSLNSNSRY